MNHTQNPTYLRFLALIFVLIFGLKFDIPQTYAQGGGRISYGETVDGELTTGRNLEEWVFRASVGEIISIQAISNEVSMRIRLYDEFGLSVTVDYYDGSNILIENIRIPASGAYTVSVTPRESWHASIGSYSLTVQLTGFDSAMVEPVESGPINYDETLTGHLFNAEQVDVWTFSGERGDIVTINIEKLRHVEPSMWPGGTDLTLELHQGNALVARVSGAPRRPTMSLNQITLPVTGNYQIHVYTQHVGSYYTISPMLHSQRGDDGAIISTGGEIEFGQLVIGRSLPASEYNAWQFTGQQGDIVNVEVKATTAINPPECYIVNARGDILARQDGRLSLGQREWNITQFELPYSGDYWLIAENRRTEGYYDLLIYREGVVPEIRDGGIINNGETLGGAFSSENYEDEWTFEAPEGAVVTISMKRLNGNVVCDFELFDPQGGSIAVADVSVNRIDAESILFELPTSGTYTLVTRSFSKSQEGAYSISLVVSSQ